MTFDPATTKPYVAHLDPTRSDGLNTLGRFLRIPSVELDRVKSLIDYLKKAVDVDLTHADLLPYIAYLVGLDLNKDLPIVAQRREIKRVVAVYKRKGTIPGFQYLIEGITGMDSIVVEHGPNVLVTNTPDRTTGLSDPFVVAGMGLPGEIQDYIIGTGPDRIYSFDSFTVFLLFDSGSIYTQVMARKTQRVMDLFTPASTIGHLVVLDDFPDEEFDLSLGIVETWDDFIQSYDLDVLPDPIHYLLTNTPDKTTNTPDDLTGYNPLTDSFTDDYETQSSDAFGNEVYRLITNALGRITNYSILPYEETEEDWDDTIL